MREPDRIARNASRLKECHEVFAHAMAAVIRDMEQLGFRPRIQDAWRSPEDQLKAFNSGNSGVKFGFHNATGPQNRKEALAVDLLDDDAPLKPSKRYVLTLAAVARANGLDTGLLWKLSRTARERTDQAVRNRDFSADVDIGFDPCHVEITGITVAQAKNGVRPTTATLTPPEPAPTQAPARTLLVRRATGPLRIHAGDVAVCRAVEFNHPDPSPAELKQINWVVKSKDHTIEERRGAGAVLEFDVPESLAGHTLRFMPFANSPTPAVSVQTVVESPSDAGAEEPAPGARLVTITRENTKYFAQVNGGPRFFVGSDVRFRDSRGLMNTSDSSGTPYSPDHYRDQHGFWADFIFPIALCESRGFFQCINTYDRARFTFGFFQMAVHTPGDNFVLLLRELLKLPLAEAYFPDLKLHDGAIHRSTEAGLVRLETGSSTDLLADYLNPVRSSVDDVEAVNAAKFVHWSLHDKSHRDVQVAFAVAQLQKKMRSYHQRYNLHRVPDTICIAVADIRHQGRARSADIIDALQSHDPLGNLLRIGEDGFPQRIRTLREAILDGQREGRIGTHHYDALAGDFRPN